LGWVGGGVLLMQGLRDVRQQLEAFEAKRIQVE
jgi:hypothetical protein